MKTILRNITVVLFGALVVSCGGGAKEGADNTKATPHKENQKLVEAGMRDARAALACDSGSAERVNAVLEIHAKAYEMSSKGMPNCAEDYLAGARRVLSEL